MEPCEVAVSVHTSPRLHWKQLRGMGAPCDLCPSFGGRVLGGLAGGGTQEVKETGADVKDCKCIQGEGEDMASCRQQGGLSRGGGD